MEQWTSAPPSSSVDIFSPVAAWEREGREREREGGREREERERRREGGREGGRGREREREGERENKEYRRLLQCQ